MTKSITNNSFLRASASPREQKSGFARRRGGAEKWLSLLALVPAPAIAQVPVTGECVDCIVVADSRISGIIVTANGAESVIENVGQAVTEIKLDTLESRQTVSVADILSTTPGITVTRNGGIGQTTAVRIRGAEGDQTLVLIDGVRVNDPSSPGGAFDFANLLSGNISRIEVLRGPNSVPWGSQALGGVVNIVTAPVPSDFGGSIRAEYGYKNSKQLVGQIGRTLGIVSASLGGGYFDNDGISAFSGGTERDGYRQYAANARVGIALSDTVSLDFRGYYANSRSQYDGFQSSFPYAQIDTAEFSKTQELFGYAGLNAQTGNLKNRLSFTISDINRDYFDPAFGTAVSFLGRGRVERFEYQGDWEISDSVRTVFGVEHENSRYSDGFSPASTRVTSGYAQLIVKPSDTLTLTGGARVDDHKTYGSKATFSANAAWRPFGGTTIRASFGQGFKAPTLYQLFSFYGNTALKPETADSFDAGVEQSLLDGALKFGATYFHRDTINQIDFASCFGSSAPICVTRPDGYYDNIARTRAQGVEAFIEMRPTNRLTATLNYSLIDAKNRVTGARLIRRPVNSINGAIDWKARDWLNLGASVQTVGDSLDGFGGGIRLDGYTLVGLRAAVSLGDRFELYGRVENLFDARYTVVSGYGTLGRNSHIGVRAKF
jgi:vitamin B12 transporter